MEENLYKKLKSVGASNLVFGILIILFGIGAGVMMIINGARLLAHKSDSLYREVCMKNRKIKVFLNGVHF